MYKRIIDDTFEQSQVTFEEEGINQQTLDELRAVGSFLCLWPSGWSSPFPTVGSMIFSSLFCIFPSLSTCMLLYSIGYVVGQHLRGRAQSSHGGNSERGKMGMGGFSTVLSQLNTPVPPSAYSPILAGKVQASLSLHFLTFPT